MVKMYKLCSEQLSQQDHYDYGMRQVKSVLVMAGGQKRANPELHESISLIRAMQEANVPRFLADDLPLFEGIIGDLYPNLEIPPVDYGALKSACEDALVRAGLQVVPRFVVKTIELYQTIRTLAPDSLVLLGSFMGFAGDPSFGARFTCWAHRA